MSTLWQSHSFTVLLASAGVSDVPFLAHDPVLNRVRVDESVAAVVPAGEALNTNPDAEADTSGWLAFGGALAHSVEFAHSGVGSGRFTPDGASASGGVIDLSAPNGSAAEGEERQVSAWVYIPTGHSQVRARLQWLDSGGGFLASANGPTTNVPANTWTFLTVTATAPALTARVAPVVDVLGTPPATAVTYVDELTATADVRTAGPVPAGAVRTVERSTDLINWTTVRGGAEMPVDGLANPLSDLEFAGNAENTYRVRVWVEDTLYWTFRDSISVVVDAIWLKPIRRPFLSRTVTVTEHSEVERTGRSGIFDVVGRSLPVAVVDLHGAQRYTLEIMTVGAPAAAETDLVLASGDVFFLQGPPECPVPQGHYVIGDMTRARRSTRGPRRYFALPMNAVAAPAPEFEGVTFTWRSMLNTYATWEDVANSGLTWREIDELIGTARDVIV